MMISQALPNPFKLVLSGTVLALMPVATTPNSALVNPTVLAQTPQQNGTATGSGQMSFSLPIKAQSGNCPKVLQVRQSWRYYEGGGENTIIPDTRAIAGTAKYISGNSKTAEFRAALKPEFATCKGQYSPTPDYPYRVQLSNGKVIFRVELPPDTPANPSAITYRAILTGRPYIRWAIAD